jgi:nucleoid-associated protein YgaU
MFDRRSRYADARPFSTGSVEPFAGVRPRSIAPATGVVEHTVRQGDRLDLLAKHYYNDDRLWWRIVDANPDLLHGAEAVGEKMVGQVLLIPAARG